MNEQDIVERLRIRAEIRRQIPGRKSVQEGKSDRIADLLEEAAHEIDRLQKKIDTMTLSQQENPDAQSDLSIDIRK